MKDTVRNTTYERYEQISRTHIIPMLGDVKLKGLSLTHVRGLYKEKLQTLGPRTVQYYPTCKTAPPAPSKRL